MRFLKFKHQKWKLKIGTFATGLCIPVIDGYVSIDNLAEIESVKNEGLDKILTALKKKYHIEEVDANTVPEETIKKFGLIKEPEKIILNPSEIVMPKEHIDKFFKKVEQRLTYGKINCKACGKKFERTHPAQKYCEPCRAKSKK